VADTAKPISLLERHIIRLINGLTLQLKPQGNCILWTRKMPFQKNLIPCIHTYYKQHFVEQEIPSSILLHHLTILYCPNSKYNLLIMTPTFGFEKFFFALQLQTNMVLPPQTCIFHETNDWQLNMLCKSDRNTTNGLILGLFSF